MKRKPRNFDIFSLSFLDVISCGFGAVILLVLISKNDPEPATLETAVTKDLLSQIFAAETIVSGLEDQLANELENRNSKEVLLKRLQATANKSKSDQSVAKAEASNLERDLEGLELVQSSLKRAGISKKTAEVRDDEVGGIPVDSDYVVFIIDTSGSMKAIWGRVIRELENVIRIHPKIKGFQILNDNGTHILSAYNGKWIPDTPRRRQSVIDLLKTWNSLSNSSPVEGLEVALKRYARSNVSVSIYIFGDEYSGSSYDPVINALVNLNTDRVTGKTRARIHAVGFISSYSTGRFATLMREVTRRNDGTFIALPY